MGSPQPRTQSIGKVRRLYHQKYRDDWEKFPSFSSWLCRGNDGVSAHCSVCDVNVLARLASIKQHHSTAKHQKAIKAFPPGLRPVQIRSRSDARPMPQKNVGGKAKPKPKVIRIKSEKVVTPVESIDQEDSFSNDSILDDLLGNEHMEQEYLDEMNNEQEQHIDIKQELLQDYNSKYDDVQEENLTDENIISEFDLFGKSVSLQLNQMELEDALLCQERLQVVLTEFRLKILKRKAKRNF